MFGRSDTVDATESPWEMLDVMEVAGVTPATHGPHPRVQSVARFGSAVAATSVPVSGTAGGSAASRLDTLA